MIQADTVSRAACACVRVCVCARARECVVVETISIQVLVTIVFLAFSNPCHFGEWAAKEVLRA